LLTRVLEKMERSRSVGEGAGSIDNAMRIRDRIKELRRVKAKDLLPNPKNWRRHPKEQAEALRGLLTEVGYADALLARELPGGKLIRDKPVRFPVSS